MSVTLEEWRLKDLKLRGGSWCKEMGKTAQDNLSVDLNSRNLRVPYKMDRILYNGFTCWVKSRLEYIGHRKTNMGRDLFCRDKKLTSSRVKFLGMKFNPTLLSHLRELIVIFPHSKEGCNLRHFLNGDCFLIFMLTLSRSVNIFKLRKDYCSKFHFLDKCKESWEGRARLHLLEEKVGLRKAGLEGRKLTSSKERKCRVGLVGCPQEAAIVIPSISAPTCYQLHLLGDSPALPSSTPSAIHTITFRICTILSNFPTFSLTGFGYWMERWFVKRGWNSFGWGKWMQGRPEW